MRKYQSKMQAGGIVEFPKYNAERIYMEPFFKSKGLPQHLKHWQSTVDQMLKGIDTKLPIYLMIDQAFVPAGQTHRRPGLHVDGYWVPSVSAHGGSSGGHSSQGDSKGGHESGQGSHKETPSKGGHGSGSGSHTSKSVLHLGQHGGHRSKAVSWETASFEAPEAIILASNVSAARGFVGEYKGPIKEMGHCEHLSVSGMKEVIMEANRVYVGNVTLLHESLPVLEDSYRTLVRLNVPGFNF